MKTSCSHNEPWWRSPLLHFSLIGAALFCFELLTNKSQDQTIVVPAAWLDAQRTKLGANTEDGAQLDAQLETAVRRYARDEALVREAIGLGLHHSDLIVRRRLIQQIEFIHEDLAFVTEPDDATLQRWIDNHPSRFEKPERRTLEHIFFSRDRRPESLGEDADRALEKLTAKAQQDTQTRDDPKGDPFMGGRRHELRTAQQLSKRFGPNFSKEVFALPAQRWSQPIESAYGLHLVRVLEIDPSAPAQLDDVRAAARAEVLAASRKEAAAAWEATLLEQYDVVMEEAGK